MRRGVLLAFSLVLSLALLLALAVWVIERSGAVLIRDPLLATPYQFKESSRLTLSGHSLHPLVSSRSDRPDRLEIWNAEGRAVIELKRNVPTFARHTLGLPPQRFPTASVPVLPEQSWHREEIPGVGVRLVRAGEDGSVLQALEPLACADRNGDGRLGLGPTVCDLLEIAGRRRIIVALSNDEDRPPRGVGCFDLDSGQLVWLYPMAQDPQSIQVADVRGDGQPEILITGWAAGNDYVVGDRCDSVCCIALIDLDGREIWYREGGKKWDYSVAVAGRLSPDRAQRICWVLLPRNADASPTTEVLMLDPDRGALLRQQEYEGICNSLVPADVDGDRNSEVVGGFSTGVMRAWDAMLDVVREARFPDRVTVALSCDLNGDETDELVGLIGGQLSAYGQDLRLLAVAPVAIKDTWMVPGPGRSSAVVPLRDGGGGIVLAALDAVLAPRFVTLRVGSAIAGGLPLGSVAGLLAASLALGVTLGSIYRRPAGRRREPEPRAEPALTPELAKSLYPAVSEILHAANRTNPLVRVQQLFGYLGQGQPISAQLPARLADAAQAFLAEGSPGLLRLSSKVTGLGAELPELAAIERAYTELTAALGRQTGAGLDPARLQADAGRIAELAATALRLLRELRERLRAHLTTDLVTAVQRALRAEMPQIRDAQIRTVDVHVDLPVATQVFCEQEDLHTILANLIANSLRAMATSPQRRLSFRIRSEGETILLEVEDSGCGIPADRHEAVFGPGGSDKPDGGFGLPRARRVLQEYRGRIAVDWSEPGSGTRMALTFQAAQVAALASLSPEAAPREGG